MSKFFQTSLKKEKLNRAHLKNDVNHEKKNIHDESVKKKHTKKFMISPNKDKSDKLDKQDKKETLDIENNINNNDHIFNIIQNDFDNTNNINILKSVSTLTHITNKTDLSLMYNRCASPLYKNIDTNKNSISSTLFYEPIIDTISKNDNNNFHADNNINKYKINELQKEEKNYTSINKLNFNTLSNEPTLTFIQKDKYKLYNYNIMLDTKINGILDYSTDIPCYHCRRKFDHVPLGVPVKYYPSLYIMIDNSLQTSKYSFNYKENTIKLNNNEKERIINILNNNPNLVYDKICNKDNKKEGKKEHKVITKNFFETEGIVCSFNCMVSYIDDNSLNPLYQNSYNYLHLMYKYIFGEYPSNPIIRAPSWKLRKEYGGQLNDTDYAKYLQEIPIVDSKQIKTINNNIKPEFVYEVLV